MQLTLIRHLPTDWNRKTWLQGRRDIGIAAVTEEILQGIAENQKLLQNSAPFDLVLASTLKRTQQTAKLYGFEVETECLLDELDFGPFEGVPKNSLLQSYGEKWIENPIGIVLGESIKDLEHRIKVFVEKYQDYQSVLVFGHGAWTRAILSLAKYGHINHMNKIPFINNECTSIHFDTVAKRQNWRA